MEVGAQASVDRAFTADDVREFARLSGDYNPLHLDDDAARASGFERSIVHGALAASLISRLLGTELPGDGTIYLGQDVKFLRPIYVGDAVTARVEVVEVRHDKPVIRLRTTVETRGEVAIDGTAAVLYRGARG